MHAVDAGGLDEVAGLTGRGDGGRGARHDVALDAVVAGVGGQEEAGVAAGRDGGRRAAIRVGVGAGVAGAGLLAEPVLSHAEHAVPSAASCAVVVSSDVTRISAAERKPLPAVQVKPAVAHCVHATASPVVARK